MDILGHLNQPPGQLVDWAEGEQGRIGEWIVGEAFTEALGEQRILSSQGLADSTGRKQATSKAGSHVVWKTPKNSPSSFEHLSHRKHVLWDSHKIP